MRTRTRVLGVLLLAMAIAWYAWESDAIALKDRFVPKRWSTVEEGAIYRSGQLSRHLVQRTLEQYGVDVVIDLTADLPEDANQQAEKEAIAALGLLRYKLPLNGNGTGEAETYARAVAALHEARTQDKTVLVHCASGDRRTGGVLAAYELLIEGKTPSQAFAEMERHRGRRSLDPTLLNYLQRELPRIAKLLVERKVLSRVPDPLPRLPDAEGVAQ